jgi:hypothetical protein
MVVDMKPSNLLIETPSYNVWVYHPEGGRSRSLLTVRDRTEWKRETAITHARYFAFHNPACTVHVCLA